MGFARVVTCVLSIQLELNCLRNCNGGFRAVAGGGGPGDLRCKPKLSVTGPFIGFGISPWLLGTHPCRIPY